MLCQIRLSDIDRRLTCASRWTTDAAAHAHHVGASHRKGLVVDPIDNILGVLAGGLMAILGIHSQARLGASQERRRLRAEKLERAYLLCQAVYDGHKQELVKARRLLPAQTTEFSQSRKHPGAEMSELKMLVRCYAAAYAHDLKGMEDAHSALKKGFLDLEDRLGTASPDDLQQNIEAFLPHLDALGLGADVMKRSLEGCLDDLVSRK